MSNTFTHRTLRALTSLIFPAACAFGAEPMVEFVNAVQARGTRLVEIRFRVRDDDDDAMTVTLTGHDRQTGEDIPLTGLTGPGADGSALWNGTHTLTWKLSSGMHMERFGIHIEVAEAVTHALSGRITGTVQGGVTIDLTGATNAQVVTNEDGTYRFPSLINGFHTITPRLPGSIFYPSGRQIEMAEAGITGVEFRSSAGGETDQGLYLVIDLSGGADAESYAVSYRDAAPLGGWTEAHRTTKMVLRRVPAGTFTMGGADHEEVLGRGGDEIQHGVTLSRDFYIGVFEVTQRQWELVTGTNPSAFQTGNISDSYGELDSHRPVELVTYSDLRGDQAGSAWPATTDVDADSFLGELRARTGIEFDLPTEAQWEYACRAGTTTSLNRGNDITTQHDWCPNLDAVGWYDQNANANKWSRLHASSHAEKNGTQPVGRKKPNAWGLYDMHGNVGERCLDWLKDDLGTSPVTDPVGPASGDRRAVRGGYWSTSAKHCRAAERNWFGSEDRMNPLVGVRLAAAAR